MRLSYSPYLYSAVHIQGRQSSFVNMLASKVNKMYFIIIYTACCRCFFFVFLTIIVRFFSRSHISYAKSNERETLLHFIHK